MKQNAAKKTNLIMLPPKYYVQRNLPAQVMSVCFGLVQKAGEFEFNPGVVEAVNAEAASGFTGFPEDFQKLVLTDIYLKANEIVSGATAKNELTRLVAFSVLIAKRGEMNRELQSSSAYMTAVGILDEVNSDDGKQDWQSVTDLRAATASATLAYSKVTMAL